MDAYLNAVPEEILEAIEELRDRNYSDIRDGDNRQYVDFVQEGGGVLGVALVGYTWVLEQCNIRFLNLAGTSAGAINTVAMAAAGRIDESRSDKILQMVTEVDMKSFMDGPAYSKRLVNRIMAGMSRFWLAVPLSRSLAYLSKNLGLHKGDTFQNWFAHYLRENGVETLSDLMQVRAEIPEGIYRLGEGEEKIPFRDKPEFCLIASDITTATKVIFPQMASLYWKEPESVDPAEFVRASMSIPLFFKPFTLDGIPDSLDGDRAALEEKWLHYAGYKGPIPKSVKFADGGMLSNFPIDVFHVRDRIPGRPTFGVRLSTFRKNYSKNKSLGSLAGSLISTMRQFNDYDFLIRNPEYRSLVGRINADAVTDQNGEKKFHWLDFNMGEEEKIKLFVLGAKRAVEFLRGFEWEDYKEMRKKPLESGMDGDKSGSRAEPLA